MMRPKFAQKNQNIPGNAAASGKEATPEAPVEGDKDKEKEELEKAFGKNDGPCVTPLPRTFETAALLKSGVGGTATFGAGDASLDQVGAADGQGLPGASGKGPEVSSDSSSYKGEPTDGDAGDDANSFGPGKAVKKFSPPSKKIDDG